MSHTRDELNALRDLLTAAMADCDMPGAGAGDREEWQRLAAYRGVVTDALRDRQAAAWRPDAQAMADYLAGDGPSPLTELGHSLHWEPAEAVPAAAAASGSWVDDVVALSRPGPAPVAPPQLSRAVPEPRRVHERPPVTAHAVPGCDRIWLDVPYADRRAADRAGAIYDPVRKSWYAPRPGISALTVWSQLPEVLAGEDRTFGQGLFVDLIPKTSWFANVRAVVSERDWHRIRKMARRRAGDRCEACGARQAKAVKRYLECHERFSYHGSGGTGLQMLQRLICLCSDCHRATHYGHTALSGPQAEAGAQAHLMRVTGMSPAQLQAHLDEAWRIWEQRSVRQWTVDLSIISRAGVAVSDPAEGGASAWAS
jgi:hypothetical protein